MRKSSRVKGFAILTAAVMLAGLGSAELTQAADEEAAKVASLIDAIYVQQRTDETDALCEEAKAAWDALTNVCNSVGCSFKVYLGKVEIGK